jgi:hypothetical protein
VVFEAEGLQCGAVEPSNLRSEINYGLCGQYALKGLRDFGTASRIDFEVQKSRHERSAISTYEICQDWGHCQNRTRIMFDMKVQPCQALGAGE